MCLAAGRQAKEERAAPAHVTETKRVAGAVKAAKSAARQFQQTGSKPREAAKAALTATGAVKKKSQKKRDRESGTGDTEAAAEKVPRVTRVYAGTGAELGACALGCVALSGCRGCGMWSTAGVWLQAAARVARSRRPRQACPRAKKQSWRARVRASRNSRARRNTSGSECARHKELQIRSAWRLAEGITQPLTAAHGSGSSHGAACMQVCCAISMCLVTCLPGVTL